VILIAAGGAPWYAWVAALSVALLPNYISGEDTGSYLNIMFGVFAIGIAVAPAAIEALDLPRRIAAMRGRVRVPGLATAGAAGDFVVTAFDGAAGAEPRPSADRQLALLPAPRPADLDHSGDVLEVRGLTVRFGGVVAVDNLDLRARRGEITALIGPNGAGKTTTFNATSGLVRASSGAVVLNGRDVTRLGPASRARLGMGRTFQEMNLFDGMTVFENIAVVSDSQDAGWVPWRQMLPRFKARRAIEVQVRATAELCGVGDVLDTPAGLLSTAQRRMVDLARALMSSPDLLMLDEPLSGLDVAEGEASMLLLRRLCAERGTAILVVEHDMDFVVKMADHVHVLNFGRLIFEGDAAGAMESDVVREAYIGSPKEAVGETA